MPRAELPDSARCVISGGGAGGTSLAYHLAELGWDDVVLVDRNELTSGSTFHSAGLVGQLRGSGALTRMMMDFVEVYRTLGSREGGGARAFGLPLETISAHEAQERFPLMVTDGVRAASLLPTDGYLDPSL